MNKKMDKMPEKIKNKLRRLSKLCMESQLLEKEICEMFESYGINSDVMSASIDSANYDDVYTEGLAFITNAEGEVEDNISLIEEVFLHYVNQQ